MDDPSTLMEALYQQLITKVRDRNIEGLTCLTMLCEFLENLLNGAYDGELQDEVIGPITDDVKRHYYEERFKSEWQPEARRLAPLTRRLRRAHGSDPDFPILVDRGDMVNSIEARGSGLEWRIGFFKQDQIVKAMKHEVGGEIQFFGHGVKYLPPRPHLSLYIPMNRDRIARYFQRYIAKKTGIAFSISTWEE